MFFFYKRVGTNQFTFVCVDQTFSYNVRVKVKPAALCALVMRKNYFRFKLQNLIKTRKFKLYEKLSFSVVKIVVNK